MEKRRVKQSGSEFDTKVHLFMGQVLLLLGLPHYDDLEEAREQIKKEFDQRGESARIKIIKRATLDVLMPHSPINMNYNFDYSE